MNEPNHTQKPKTGIDQWNDRLDKNLEPEQRADELADDRAREYSEEEGSGDQSDENPGEQAWSAQ